MPTTAGTLITRTARSIGFIGRGQSLEAGESADGLEVLNEMLQEFNRHSLLIYRTERYIGSLPASQQTRLIGSGSGQFTADRPDRIVTAGWIDSSNNESPIAVLRTIQQWAAVPDKLSTGSNPTRLFYDPTITQASPYGTIYFHPIPTQTLNIALYLWGRFLSIANLTTQIWLPDGYLTFLWSNLALRLGPCFNQPVPQDMKDLAQSSMESIKSLNVVPSIAIPDFAAVGYAGSGHYNPYTDEYA